MRIVFQRTKNANVIANGTQAGVSTFGATLLVCLEKEDNTQTIEKAVSKIISARVFEDENGKMNLNIKQVNGSILAISQFTLSWRGDKGNRPSFDRSMPPKEAEELFQTFCTMLGQHVPTQTGVFGASMEVQLTNLGPVTFIFEF